MTPEQYWQGDPALVRAFRKANELRKERLNQEAWWQGLYFYEALCASSPLFRAFGKKGTKAAPYPKEPYDINPNKKRKRKAPSAEEKQMLRMKSIMQAFMANNNSVKNKQKGGTSPNGGQRSND